MLCTNWPTNYFWACNALDFVVPSKDAKIQKSTDILILHSMLVIRYGCCNDYIDS